MPKATSLMEQARQIKAANPDLKATDIAKQLDCSPQNVRIALGAKKSWLGIQLPVKLLNRLDRPVKEILEDYVKTRGL